MGKNKKNKHQNRVNLDSSDDESKINTNIETTTSPSYNENKKKNVFNKLNILDMSDEDSNNSINEIKSQSQLIQSIQSTKQDTQKDIPTNIQKDILTNIQKDIPTNISKNDKYFAQAYHEDDYEHDYTKAIELYEQSLIHDDITYHGVAAHNMGLLYKEKFNDLINAEKYYKIACENNYKDSFLNLGLIYYNQNNYIDAEKYFANAVTHGEISIFKEYAHTLEQLDKKKDSFKYLQYHLMLKNANYSEKKMFSRLIKQV
jgi:tetratricopeptide (TPR) repeat protein